MTAGLVRAMEMLERIEEVSAQGDIPAKLPALTFTVQLAIAYAVLGLGQEVAAVHDQLCDLELAYRAANGMEPA